MLPRRLRQRLTDRAEAARLSALEAVVSEMWAQQEASIELFRRTPQFLGNEPLTNAHYVDHRYLSRDEHARGERYDIVLPAIDGLTVTSSEPGFVNPYTGRPGGLYAYTYDFHLAFGGNVHYLLVRRDAEGHPSAVLRNMVGISGPAPKVAERAL